MNKSRVKEDNKKNHHTGSSQSDFEYIVSRDKCIFLMKHHYAMLLKYSPQ